MQFLGDIEFSGNEASLGQIIKPGMGTETSFPQSASVGRIVFVNKRLWMAVGLSGTDLIWVPLTNTLDTYTHVQTAASSTWTINHNLNTGTPIVQVYDSATQKLIIPSDVEVISNNQVVVTLGTAIAGRATIIYGDPTIGIVGGAQVLQPDQMTFTFTQTVAAATWVVVHNLGYNPIVRVFDNTGNQEIQPLSIVHDSVFQVTIQFSAVTAGIARLV